MRKSRFTAGFCAAWIGPGVGNCEVDCGAAQWAGVGGKPVGEGQHFLPGDAGSAIGARQSGDIKKVTTQPEAEEA